MNRIKSSGSDCGESQIRNKRKRKWKISEALGTSKTLSAEVKILVPL